MKYLIIILLALPVAATAQTTQAMLLRQKAYADSIRVIDSLARPYKLAADTFAMFMQKRNVLNEKRLMTTVDMLNEKRMDTINAIIRKRFPKLK